MEQRISVHDQAISFGAQKTRQAVNFLFVLFKKCYTRTKPDSTPRRKTLFVDDLAYTRNLCIVWRRKTCHNSTIYVEVTITIWLLRLRTTRNIQNNIQLYSA